MTIRLPGGYGGHGHGRSGPFGLQGGPPADEHPVDGGSADDRLLPAPPLRPGEGGRMEDDRPRLRAAEAAVERDQLLERAALLERRVEEAVQEQVRRVLE